MDDSIVPMFNVRLSNQVDGVPREPYFAESRFRGAAPDVPRQTSGNTQDNVSAPNDDVLYAIPPKEHFDFPKEIFANDGLFTIKAWAENDEGNSISPPVSVVLSVQQGASVLHSDYAGYSFGAGTKRRTWGSTAEGLSLPCTA